MSRPMILGPRIGTPVAGLYAVRLVKNGPLCPLRIWQGFPLDPITREPLERGWLWRAELFEEEVDVWKFWPYCSGRPIPDSEYRYMLALRRHALVHEPTMAEATPHKAVDLLTVAPPF